jgi:hypothetical protein
MINFKFDKDMLLLMQEGDTEEYPSEWIPVRLFGNLDDYGEQRSFWIDYLDTQPWVPKSSLYFLAKIIQDKCPDNKIDWLKTFYKVELNRLVSRRMKEILSQKPGKRKLNARAYIDILKSRLTSYEEIQATVSMAEIVAMVEKNAARYNVSLNR